MRPLPFLLLALTSMLNACGDDDAPPTIPPIAELELLAPGSTQEETRPCVRRGDDARKSITLEVAVRNFTLRPPLGCTVHECGFVEITLDQEGTESFVFHTAGRSTSISTLELRDGDVEIEARLLDTSGERYRSRDDEPVPCKNCPRYFTLDATCGESPPGDDDLDDDDVDDDAPDDGQDEVDSGLPSDDGGATPSLDAGAVEPPTDAGEETLSDASVLDTLDASIPGTVSDAGIEALDAESPSPVDAAMSSDDSGTEPSSSLDSGSGL